MASLLYQLIKIQFFVSLPHHHSTTPFYTVLAFLCMVLDYFVSLLGCN